MVKTAKLLSWIERKVKEYQESTGREHIVLVKPGNYGEQSVWNIWKKLGEELSPQRSVYVVYGSLLAGEPLPNPRKRLQTSKRKYTDPWDIMLLDNPHLKKQLDEKINKRINSEAS